MCSEFMVWYCLVKFNKWHLSFCKYSVYSHIVGFTFMLDQIVWLEFQICKASISSSCNYVKIMSQFPNQSIFMLLLHLVRVGFLEQLLANVLARTGYKDCMRKTFCTLALWLESFQTIVSYFRERKSNVISFCKS